MTLISTIKINGLNIKNQFQSIIFFDFKYTNIKNIEYKKRYIEEVKCFFNLNTLQLNHEPD